eukprot:528958-Pleurochrysis_carterae.AAC.1
MCIRDRFLDPLKLLLLLSYPLLWPPSAFRFFTAQALFSETTLLIRCLVADLFVSSDRARAARADAPLLRRTGQARSTSRVQWRSLFWYCRECMEVGKTNFSFDFIRTAAAAAAVPINIGSFNRSEER